MRWAMCTDDITTPACLKKILIAGKPCPSSAAVGWSSPSSSVFPEAREGHWGHIFAEGSIRQPWRFSRESRYLRTSRPDRSTSVAQRESTDGTPDLPHRHAPGGAGNPGPEGRPRKLVKKLPNIGRKILVYVGDPIDVGPVVRKCRERMATRHLPWTKRLSRAEIECHQEIAAFVRDHVLKLEEIARRLLWQRTGDLCPYAVAE
ncbi:unnamed protein product [Ascophyllum nodosum]